MRMIEVIRLHRFDNDSSLKAFADIVANGIRIKGIRVLADRNDGLFVAMPSAQGKDGKWYETVSILEEELKQELQEVVLDAYNV